MTRTLTGHVEATLIAPDADSILSIRQPEVHVIFEGFAGDRHAGLTVLSGSRTSHYPRGTEIRNSRQVSILSREDLAEVATVLGVPHIPSLTRLPPMSRLSFAQNAVLVVAGENFPCTTTGQAIQDQYPDVAGITAGFTQAALHKRGIVAWVERPGLIAPGDSVRAEVPEQVLWVPPT